MQDSKEQLKNLFIDFLDSLIDNSNSSQILQFRCILKNFITDETFYNHFNDSMTPSVIKSIRDRNEEIFIDKSFFNSLDKTGMFTSYVLKSWRCYDDETKVIVFSWMETFIKILEKIRLKNANT